MINTQPAHRLCNKSWTLFLLFAIFLKSEHPLWISFRLMKTGMNVGLL